MRPNILFSTTRMWNCGDDFILFGLRNLISRALPDFNAIAYNRHPALHLDAVLGRRELQVPGTAERVAAKALLKPYARQGDNSWRVSHGLPAIDYCIFAGTPEWQGVMTRPLLEQLATTDVPLAYLGIGTFENLRHARLENLDPLDVAALRRGRLITARDESVAEILAPLQVQVLPCPALFASPSEKPRSSKSRVALSLQGTEGNQRIPKPVFDFTVKLFEALAAVYDCALVYHYVDELFELADRFGSDLPVVFSYDAADYAGLYDNFDLIVTTRVHGAGLGASLGIPAFVIMHSDRSPTVRGFLSETIDPEKETVETALARIDGFAVPEASKKLIAHKRNAGQAYTKLLEDYFA